MTYTNTGQFHFLAQNDLFALHDPLIARDKYDLKQFYDLAVQALQIDGKLYVLPFKGQIARLFAFYNVDLFESAGVKVPTSSWTYADLADAAARLHRGSGDAPDVWGYAGAWKELTTMIGSVRPWGGEIISADGKKAVDQHGAGQGVPELPLRPGAEAPRRRADHHRSTPTRPSTRARRPSSAGSTPAPPGRSSCAPRTASAGAPCACPRARAASAAACGSRGRCP